MVVTHYSKANKVTHMITTSGEFYFLYELNGKEVKKISRAKSPLTLEKKIP